MALEIERKFLVKDMSFVGMACRHADIEQGYLSRDPERTVRVRIYGHEAFITIKTKNVGAVRNEWEYPIPINDAKQMMGHCIGVLSKTRYIVPVDGHMWEVDLFHNRHEGLILAEIELDSPEQAFKIPDFIGDEVTGDPKYFNSNLI